MYVVYRTEVEIFENFYLSTTLGFNLSVVTLTSPLTIHWMAASIETLDWPFKTTDCLEAINYTLTIELLGNIYHWLYFHSTVSHFMWIMINIKQLYYESISSLYCVVNKKLHSDILTGRYKLCIYYNMEFRKFVS